MKFSIEQDLLEKIEFPYSIAFLVVSGLKLKKAGAEGSPIL